ncbi:MAG: PAS domain S-box protein, partial [Elusimicrobiota bacterium]|nr:PAS domain S-box protein [Elusimicrobiota bacterium]
LRAIETGKAQGPYELELIHKNGSKVLVEVRENPIVKNGKTVAIVGALVDITAQKKDQEALKESEDRYRTLFEASVAGILIANIKTKKFKYANPAICKMLGYTAKELCSMSVLDIHPKKDLKKVLIKFKEQASGKTPIAEALPCARKNGKIIYVDIAVSAEMIDGEPCSIGFFTDVTKRKQLEEKRDAQNKLLKANEEQLTLFAKALEREKDFTDKIIKTAQAIILVLDKDGKIVAFNPYMKKIGGYKLSEVKGKDWFSSFLPKCDYSKVRKVFKKVLNDFPVSNDINSILTKAGEERLIEWNSKILKESNGKILGVVSIGVDITERVKAEEKLRESKTKLQLLYDSSSDAIMLLDGKGFFDCNDATLKLFGCACKKDFCSRHPGNFSPPTQWDGTDSMKYARNNIARALKEGYARFEHLHRRLDGSDFPAQVLLNKMVLNGKEVIQARVYDITKRKEAEEALKASEIKFKSLFETAVEGILIADSKTKKFNYANKVICDMLGYSEEEICSRSVLNIHPKKDLKHILTTFEKQAKGEKPIATNLPCQRKDGTVFYADIAVSAEVIDGKKCNIGFFTDITERKKMLEDLLVSREKFYKVFQASPSSILITHLDTGKIINMNKSFERTFGYKREEIVSRTTFEIGFWKKTTEGKRIKRELLKEGYLQAPHLEFITKADEIVIADTNFTLMEIGGENYSITTILDITEKKRVEKELSETYNIVNHSPAVTFLWKNERGWPVEFVSNNVEKLTGYAAQEFIKGKITYADIIHEGDLERVVKEVAAYGRKKKLKSFNHVSYRIITKNGNTKWVEDTTYIRRDSRKMITHHEGIVHDITKRKEMEIALSLSAEKYQSLFDNSISAIYLFDTKKRFTDSNQAGLDLLGYSREELLSKSIKDVDADTKVTLPAHNNLLKGGNLINYEHKLKRKDGKIITVLNNSRPLKDAGGKVIGMQSTLFNITDFKTAEKIRITMSSMDDLVFVNDKDGIFIEYDQPPGRPELYVPPKVFLGKAYKDIFSPKLSKLFEKTIKAVISTGKTQEIEYSLNIKGKTEFYNAKVSIRKSKSGKFSGVTTVARNITKQKSKKIKKRK